MTPQRMEPPRIAARLLNELQWRNVIADSYHIPTSALRLPPDAMEYEIARHLIRLAQSEAATIRALLASSKHAEYNRKVMQLRKSHDWLDTIILRLVETQRP